VSTPRRERKVVTVLFADLVGFTARSETLDPEDVEAILRPYHARLRDELERFGGTVEKFIGDAVMALFGAPVAHEDDPERAVRAALAIRDWARDDGNVQVRIAVSTGEALVNLDALPQSGEGMAAGDVVNTTARLQSAASINGILVGETTYRATRSAIDYADAEPVEAKGKAEPIRVWEVLDARAQVRTEAVSTSTPLVGRDREVALLRDTLVRVREESAPQLVTIVGVPGIGKSRLVRELFEFVEQSGVLTFWRQGRSLPYGEGVSFWALSEMVKAQAGILETDDDDGATTKLHAAVTNLVSDAGESERIVQHLRPLVGIGGDTGASQSEAFAAWRHFFEAMAEQHPLVLVFEDVQWADDGLLDFIDHLVDWATRLPILIACTARPELLERRPGWGGGKLNATTLSLSPLSEQETARLLAELLGTPVLESTRQQQLLSRAGGNPLYAEQFAQMVEEGDAESAHLPETIQGIIAARLDRLSSGEKELLHDAAVLGKVFWLGGVLDGRERADVEQHLHALERKGFVQRARRSSVSDEPEYAFLHVLVRDVAYGQIPRSDRADKHRRAAFWIESLGRADDHAEMLAHHYASALELARAAGADLSGVAASAGAAFRAAGDRAMTLNAYATAVRFYEQALDLASDSDRPDLLFRLGRATNAVGDPRQHAILDEAREALLAVGDVDRAAETDAMQAERYWVEGELERANEHLLRAEEMTRDREPSLSKARILDEAARLHMVGGRPVEAIAIGTEALAIAEELGLDEIRANALTTVGAARTSRGDDSGAGEVREALALAERLRLPRVAWRARNNLAVGLFNDDGDVRASAQMFEDALREAERIGDHGQVTWFRALLASNRFWLGEFDEALRLVGLVIATDTPHYQLANALHLRARIRIALGDERGAVEDGRHAVETARRTPEPQVVALQFAGVALVFIEAGQQREAADLVDDALLLAQSPDAVSNVATFYLALALAAVEMGREQAYLEVTESIDRETPWAVAGRAYVTNDPRAVHLVEALSRPDGAFVRLRFAERLGQGEASDALLAPAIEFWRSVGATHYLRRAEPLLTKSA
jgi:class 3 adenylate cyclase/tetratricopeptide (TPR) repeat protein